QIYLGNGAYGVESASSLYFGKDVSALTLAESAFLAGLPKAPARYSPYVSPDRAKQRQGIVLKRMVAAGFITAAQYQEAFRQKLKFRKLQKEDEISPYFLDYVRQQLISQYGENTIYKGGLNVFTTLNIQMQTFAAGAVQKGLRDLDKRQGYRGPIGHIVSPEKIKKKEGPSLLTNPFEKDEIVDGIVLSVEDQFAKVEVKGITGTIRLEDMTWAKKRSIGNDLKAGVVLQEKGKANQILKKGDVIKLGFKQYDTNDKEYYFTLEQEPLVEGALIALDPLTGGIKAMVGGYDFRRSQFNRAILAKRQTGSAFKPIIYATALENGKSPSDIIIDSPVIFRDPESGKIWKPENYEGKFYGPISLRNALAHSRNLATIRLLDEIGISPVIEFGRKVGLTSPLDRNLTLALGTSSLGLVELTSAYAVFANQGVYNIPVSIESVTDYKGTVLETHERKSHQAISKEVSYMITDMLEDVIQRGTGAKARDLGRQLAGKTGTTDDFTDAWFEGYSPNLVAGVWVGFDDMRSLGVGETGASAALPIWISFMKQALPLFPNLPFLIPDNIIYAKVNPSTGLLNRDDSESTVTEPFILGFEPLKPPLATLTYSDFYFLDNSD
ncbi:MAG: penicillin-binding protein 1A, partial [Nitrospiria bacterium]